MHNCKTTTSIRKNSFFSKCKIPLSEWFLLIYLWNNSLQGKIAYNLLHKIPQNTIYGYFNFCRDVTIQRVKEEAAVFDTDSEYVVEIQIDKSIFGKKNVNTTKVKLSNEYGSSVSLTQKNTNTILKLYKIGVMKRLS